MRKETGSDQTDWRGRIFRSWRGYQHWLHTRWPAGTVEKLPEVGNEGITNLPGVRIVGDLTGIPLLKFAADSGARAVQAIAREPDMTPGEGPPGSEVYDVAIVGGGVSGLAAALEARRSGFSFVVVEATEPFSTVVNFPKRKPIFTYPATMEPAGELQFSAEIKEDLLEELEAQRIRAGIEPLRVRISRLERSRGEIWLHREDGEAPLRAKRVVVAIGRSGNYRKLEVPGESADHVYNRLYDPNDYAGQHAVVVGGGDSALETAIALAGAGARVTLSHRGREFSRAKPENVEKLNRVMRHSVDRVGIERPSSERVGSAATEALLSAPRGGSLEVRLDSQVVEILPDRVRLRDPQGESEVPGQVVFVMIGREPPLDFFRRSGMRIRGEWRASTWLGLASFFLFCLFLYTWKAGGEVNRTFQERGWFPYNVSGWMEQLPQGLAAAAADPSHLLGTLAISLREPGFYYSLAYCLCVVLFGIDRMRRKRTPYIRWQTATLAAIQVIPLFLLPYLVLPWMGHQGWFESGWGADLADAFFPVGEHGHGREYWRAFGFILAWPLFIWNFFTAEPLFGWLAVGFLQTFVIIPWMIWRWGKGAYCGWICSCGALAETLGDRHRHKMVHGPLWNRANMVGQVILAVVAGLFLLRTISWIFPGGWAESAYHGLLSGWSAWGIPINYYGIVDVFLAGVVGVGLYFWFSGRVWCRFACPLAALMHIYTRFSRFRIFADKKKCISCKVCTSVCHQGIDVMNFANKGVPMEDPQCVRCSACVQSCPTGVLSFGRLLSDGRPLFDSLPASPVQMREGRGGRAKEELPPISVKT